MSSLDMDSLKDTTRQPINPLLLLSACFGSSGALKFLFNREDAKAPLMMVPSQAFLDLLYPVGSSTTRKLSVQQSSNDIEDGVDLAHALSASACLLEGVTAEGDTALHVVATHGESTEFLECATLIFNRTQDLLFEVNKKGDTPLHSGARAGKLQIVSHLIEELARRRNRVHELLRKDNGLKETALHDAVRIGNKHIVEILLKADSELANYPKEGTSPLYLAISLEYNEIARTIHAMSNGNLSYLGPNGTNALHAATFRGAVIVEDVLKWNSSLTTRGDMDGSTPLQLAASFNQPYITRWTLTGSLGYQNRIKEFRKLFEANPAPVYQADNRGLFPIHVAASMDALEIICIILETCPSSAGLRTAQGRTFLHVAVEKRRLNIVRFVCDTVSLAWILNMRDNNGNTAMHLAVQTRNLENFRSLYGNKEVHLCLPNNSGEAPVDISKYLIPRGMNYVLSNEYMIYHALGFFGTNQSGLRWDQYEEKYSLQLRPEDQEKEEDDVKDSSQILGIGSVLIATVAFGATFAVPGGFVADDHTNRGTPTLAGRYTFDAFMMANALAFICSTIATIGLMFSGTAWVSLRKRKFNLGASAFFISSSVTCLCATFALGVYMVLAPVAHATGIAICVLSPLLVLYRSIEYFSRLRILARPLHIRKGLIFAASWILQLIFLCIIMEFWPFIFIFGWAAIAQKLRNH